MATTDSMKCPLKASVSIAMQKCASDCGWYIPEQNNGSNCAITQIAISLKELAAKEKS